MQRPARRRHLHSADTVAEAAWWLSRWVSGSMEDPDWDHSGAAFGISGAFDVLRDVVGNSRSLARPVIWRHLSLSEDVASAVRDCLELLPNPFCEFQSFTGIREIAEVEGPEIVGRRPEGAVDVLVSTRPVPDRAMFGMADLKASRHPEIVSVLRSLDNWHHQDEVILRITEPLHLLSAEIRPHPPSGFRM